MKILIVTDAWYPQINGVVRTLTKTRNHLVAMGNTVELITPESFRTIPCPTYPEIQLSIFLGKMVAETIEFFQPDAIHIATEGPLGLTARRYATSHDLNFTTAYHTRFPEYVRSRIGLPLRITYMFLRWFHGSRQAVMAPTQTVINDLAKWRIGHPVLWPRSVDLTIFNPDNKSTKHSCENTDGLTACMEQLDAAKNPFSFMSDGCLLKKIWVIF